MPGSGVGGVTLGPVVGVVTPGSEVGGVTVGGAFAVVTVGSPVGVMSTWQADPGVTVVEVIVPSHPICDGAAGVERARESLVDQKLALRMKLARRASIAAATRERAMAYRFWVALIRRCRSMVTLGVATVGRCTKDVTAGCRIDGPIERAREAEGNTPLG
jgi:hypothetical protein